MIPSNLKRIRTFNKMTQPEFAELFGASVAMQKSYEGGKTVPGLLYMEKLAQITGYSISQLTNTEVKPVKLKAPAPTTEALLKEIISRLARIEKKLK